MTQSSPSWEQKSMLIEWDTHQKEPYIQWLSFDEFHRKNSAFCLMALSHFCIEHADADDFVYAVFLNPEGRVLDCWTVERKL